MEDVITKEQLEKMIENGTLPQSILDELSDNLGED